MFKLSIESSKDIDELHINFSDGSSVVTTSDGVTSSSKSKQPNKQPSKSKETKATPRPKQEQTLDLDADFGNVSNEVVKPPEIHREERPISVAEELQNFDF